MDTYFQCKLKQFTQACCGGCVIGLALIAIGTTGDQQALLPSLATCAYLVLAVPGLPVIGIGLVIEPRLVRREESTLMGVLCGWVCASPMALLYYILLG